MEHSDHHTENPLSQKDIEQNAVLQQLFKRKAEIEAEIHQTNEKLAQLIQRSDQLLHPEKHIKK